MFPSLALMRERRRWITQPAGSGKQCTHSVPRDRSRCTYFRSRDRALFSKEAGSPQTARRPRAVRNRPGLLTFAASPAGGRSDHLGQRVEPPAVAERAHGGSCGRLSGIRLEHRCCLHLKCAGSHVPSALRTRSDYRARHDLRSYSIVRPGQARNLFPCAHRGRPAMELCNGAQTRPGSACQAGGAVTSPGVLYEQCSYRRACDRCLPRRAAGVRAGPVVVTAATPSTAASNQ